MMLKTALTAIALTATCLSPASAQTLSPDEAREDLTALYEGLQLAHYSLFADTPRAVMDEAYARLHAELDGPMTTPALHREFQRFAALAGHGHARVEGLNPGFRAHVDEGGLVFPLDLEIRDGAVVVVGAPEGSGVEVGDEVLALNGVPNALWLDRVTGYISAETPDLAYSILERTTPYAMWLAYGAPDSFEVEISGPFGHRIVSLPAVDYATYAAQPVAGTGPDLSGREARLLTPEIAYLRPGPFYNTGATTPAEAYDPAATRQFIAFVDAAFESFIASGAQTLILDLRDNPGGDASYSDPVLAWIADEDFRFYSEFRLRVSEQTTASNAARLDGRSAEEAGISGTYAQLFADAQNGEVITLDLPYTQPREPGFDGEVYALINRRSYSNAVSAGVIIQDYGFGIVAGEATTDMATMYGAMEHFYLPHSGLQIGYPKAHIIRPNSEERLHPLTPDLAIEVPLFAEGDVMLDRLVTHIEGR